MKLKTALLVSAAAVLLTANIVKYSGILKHGGAVNAASELKKICINYQKPGTKEESVPAKNIFNGPAEDTGTYSAQVYAVKKVPTPTPKIWPRFKISGFAVNEGKKCAFFSGSEFSGTVNEGAEFNDTYVLEAIKDNRAIIADKATGEQKTYTLEEK